MNIISYIYLFLGLLFIIQGMIVWKMQTVTLTFDYNSKNLRKEDVKHFTKSYGIAYTIFGFVFLLLIISKVAYNSRFQDEGGFLCIVASIISITIIIKTQVKYKTGLFN